MVAALGYFVDLYDIVIFGVVRLASLSELGLTAPLKIADVLLHQATGLAIGSGCSGLISEWMHSRKRILNVVRAMAIPITLALTALAPALGLVPAALLLGSVVFGIAFAALFTVPETYGKDLNYVEPTR